MYISQESVTALEVHLSELMGTLLHPPTASTQASGTIT